MTVPLRLGLDLVFHRMREETPTVLDLTHHREMVLDLVGELVGVVRLVGVLEQPIVPIGRDCLFLADRYLEHEYLGKLSPAVSASAAGAVANYHCATIRPHGSNNFGYYHSNNFVSNCCFPEL